MKAVCVTGPASETRTLIAAELVRRFNSAGGKAVLIKEGPPNTGASGPESGGDENQQLPRAALWSFHQSVCFLGGMSLEDLISFFNCDWAVLEGFRENDYPKIAVLSSDSDTGIWVDDITFLVVGLSAGSIADREDIEFFSPDEIEKIYKHVAEKVPVKLPHLNECGACGMSCREVARRMLRGQGDISLCATLTTPHAAITVDGEPVPMKSFVEEAFIGVIDGFLKSLKGVNVGKELKIQIPERS